MRTVPAPINPRQVAPAQNTTAASERGRRGRSKSGRANRSSEAENWRAILPGAKVPGVPGSSHSHRRRCALCGISELTEVPGRGRFHLIADPDGRGPVCPTRSGCPDRQRQLSLFDELR